jgi:4-methylaminobutanoate oxidase (formaldehyde-forming)
LAGFTVADPDAVLLGRETIFWNGAPVGWLTSGGFGHTVGKSIGYGYIRHADGVNAAFIRAGR